MMDVFYKILLHNGVDFILETIEKPILSCSYACKSDRTILMKIWWKFKSEIKMSRLQHWGYKSKSGLIVIAKTTMKIAKMYWYWAKKYTSEAKNILLKQYTFVWKFRSNTPDFGLLEAIFPRQEHAGDRGWSRVITGDCR